MQGNRSRGSIVTDIFYNSFYTKQYLYTLYKDKLAKIDEGSVVFDKKQEWILQKLANWSAKHVNK